MKNKIKAVLIAGILLLTTVSSVIGVFNIEKNEAEFTGEKDSRKLNNLQYDDASFSYNSESIEDENNVISASSNLDDTDKFELLPEKGQDKIIEGKDRLKSLKQETFTKIQILRDILANKLKKHSSKFPRLQRLFNLDEFENSKPSDTGSLDSVISNNPPDDTNTESEHKSGGCRMGILNSAGGGNEPGENITVVPESGHIIFMGQGSMELDMILDINGTVVTITGSLFIGPDISSVDLLWNLSRGYFEITCDGYFEFSDLYLNIDDKIVFVTDSIILDANGHVMVDQGGYEGDLYLDGILALSGLSFDINFDEIMGVNISMTGSFDFSSYAEANDLTISWGEYGISASGSFVSGSELNIMDFSLEFEDILVNASLITLYSSAVFDFIEDEGVVLCGITSTNLLIKDLYLGFGDSGLFVEDIEVNGEINLELEIIDPEQYITKEKGHISIGGCFSLTIDNTFNVDGTILEISGTLKLDYGHIDIEWDKSEGFFKIGSTKIVEIDDFSISVDGEWISLGWDKFIIYKEGYLLIEQIDDINNSGHLVMDKCSEIKGIYFNGAIGDFSARLSIGSILFIDGSYFEVTVYNNTVLMNLDSSLGYGLIIHNLNFEVLGFEININAIIVMGTWELYYDNNRLDIKTNGFIEILDFSLGNSGDEAGVPLLGAGYLTASGESEISIIDNGTILIGLYSMESYIRIGQAPLVGSVSIELYGDAQVKIDLVNGTIHGQIDGYGFVNTGGMSMGSIVISGISVAFEGSATFSLVGSNLSINAGFAISIRAHVYVDLNSMLVEGMLGFELHNFHLSASASVNGFLSGSFSANVNLATGVSTMSTSLGGTICVKITDIVGYGKNVWGPGDIDNDGKYDMFLKIDSIYIDFRDQDLNLAIDYQTFSITAWGSLNGGVTVEGLTVMLSKDLAVSGIIDIGLIELTADVIIEPSSMLSASVQAQADLYLEDFEFNMLSGIDIFMDSIYLDSGVLEILYVNPVEGDNSIENLEIRIDISGLYLSVNNIDIGGEIKLDGGSSIIPSAHIDNIQLLSDTSSISIYIGQDDADHDVSFVAVLDDDEEGLLHIEGLSVGGALVNAEGNTVIVGKVEIGMLDFSLNGYLKVYKDGKVEVRCGGAFAIQNLGVELDLGNGPTNIALVNDLVISFGGEIILNPGEDGKPPVIELEGEVSWDADGNIESEGSIYVDGRITVDWEKDEAGNFYYLNLKFDSIGEDEYGVFIDHFTLDTLGLGIPISVTIENYWGIGMFEFSINTQNKELFMDNQVDGVWESFNFNVKNNEGATIFSADVYHFWGDLTLSLIENRPAIDSDSGCQSYLGVKFSTDPDDGLDWLGDMSIGEKGLVHITNLHLDPGTEGMIELYSNADDPNIYNFRFSCSQGAAEMVLYVGGNGGADGRIWFKFYAEEGNAFHIQFPKILGESGVVTNTVQLLQMWNDFQNGDITLTELLEQTSLVVDQFMELDNILSELGSNTEFLGLTFEDGSTLYEWYENNKDQLPDEVRERLEDLFRSLYAGNNSSCFLKGTKIEMADGSYKKIENIGINDRVLSYNAENNVWSSGVVTDVFNHKPSEMTDYYLVLNKDLRITPNHPIMVDGEWIDAGELKIGDNFGGNIIRSIEYVYERVPTYNFEVEPYHTYNVVWGENANSVVHNAHFDESEQSTLSQKAISGDKNPCFLANTKIGMANGGTKNIQDLETGDQVLSYDFVNDTWSNGTVVEVEHHSPNEMLPYYIVVNNDLRVTPNHPVYVGSSSGNQNVLGGYGNKMGWISAGELKVGQVFDGQVITSIRQVYHRVPTYNFKVEPYHNYKVVWGETSSVAHQNESLLDKENPESGVCSGCGGPSVEDQNITPPDTPSPWGDKSCFLKGTKVEMADGTLKNIEEIDIGEKVNSFDVNNNKKEIGVVSKILHHSPDEMTEYYVTINNDLRITPNHPVFVDNKWIDAGELKIGDNFGGNIIRSIEYVYERVPTYNFEVEPYHTYNVVWDENANSVVHNAVLPEEDMQVSKVLTSDKKNPCFLKGTKIQMSDGKVKNIEEIQNGDKVKAFDTKTNSLKIAEVVEVFHHKKSEMTDYYMVINNDLRVTPNHPIYVNNNWIYAEDLKVGDNFGGELINSIEKVFEKQPTYNFDVEPYHTYKVVWGENTESIVHNAENKFESTSAYSSKYCISGTKYGVTQIADAGLESEFVIQSNKNILEPFEVVPKSVENEDGNIVVLNQNKPILSEDNTLVSVDSFEGYSVDTVEDLTERSYGVKKDDERLKAGLTSTDEVKDYLRNEVVNRGGQSEEDSNDTCCFPAGTLISMADGSEMPIEDVCVGDFVLSYDTSRGVFVSNVVKEVVSPVRDGVYSINDGLIRPTDDHPFYTRKVDGRVGWASIDPEKSEGGYLMSPMRLEVGDSIFTIGGDWVTVDSIDFVSGPVQTFNLEDVSGSSNFFADGILVHNAVACGQESISNQITLTQFSGLNYATGDEPVYMTDGIPVQFTSGGNFITFGNNGLSATTQIFVENKMDIYPPGSGPEDNDDYYIRRMPDDTCCFPAGTLISMADGSEMPIEDVCVGDFVLSYDTSRGVFVSNVVKEVVSPVRDGVYSINDGLIRPTDDHPFYTRKVDGRVGWASIDPEKSEGGYLMSPMRLEVGDSIFTIGGDWVTVDSIDFVSGPVQTFNLEDVSGSSNFFADGILVHNARDCANRIGGLIQFSEKLGDSGDILNSMFAPGEVKDYSADMDTNIGEDFPQIDDSDNLPGESTDNSSSSTDTNNEEGLPGTKDSEGGTDDSSGTGGDGSNGDDNNDGPTTPNKPTDKNPLEKDKNIVRPLVITMDNIYYPIESIVRGDTIRAFDTSTGKVVSSQVRNVSMTLTKGRYVDIELINYSKFKEDSEKIQHLDDYRDLTGSEVLSITQHRFESDLKLFTGVDQKIYVDGKFIAADEVEIGDVLNRYNSEEKLVVSSVETKRRVIPIYNITLSNINHCYFADDVLVGDYLAGQLSNSNTNKNCVTYPGFTEGTKVLMHNNLSKDIEQVQIGDFVKTFDIASSAIVNAKVIDIQENISKKYLKIEFDRQQYTPIFYSPYNDGQSFGTIGGYDGKDINLKVAPYQSLYVYSDPNKETSYPNDDLYNIDSTFTDSNLDLVKAKDLQTGDKVYLSSGKIATVSSINHIDEPVTTYNIDIQNYSNYFANNILVDDKSRFTYVSSDESSDAVDPGKIDFKTDSPIKITTVDDSHSDYVTDTICFDYYKEIDYGYFEETKIFEKSTGGLDAFISNIIEKLLKKFPVLGNFDLLKRFLDDEDTNDDQEDDPSDPNDSSDDPADEDSDEENNVPDGDDVPSEANSDPKGDSDDSFDPDIPKDEDGSDDSINNETDEEDIIPDEEDGSCENDSNPQNDDFSDPNAPSDDSSNDSEENNENKDSSRIYPPSIGETKTNSLKEKLLSIIENNRIDENQQIHYIWDFGDGKYKYGIDATHKYDLGHPESLDDSNYEHDSFQASYASSGTFNEKITYLVTLMIVDNYGNIIDMDMSTVSIESTWSVNPTGYTLVEYSINF